MGKILHDHHALEDNVFFTASRYVDPEAKLVSDCVSLHLSQGKDQEVNAEITERSAYVSIKALELRHSIGENQQAEVVVHYSLDHDGLEQLFQLSEKIRDLRNKLNVRIHELQKEGQ
jgi:hypothetical protein